MILALSLYPLIYSVWVAFVNYDFLVPGHAFVGWLNFSQVLADPVALQAVVVTLVLAGLNVFAEFVLGFALALAMSSNFRGRSVLMSLFIVPLFVSPVIVGQFWALLLQRPFGPTDYLLSLLLRTSGGDQLAEPVSLEFRGPDAGRCLAVDAVHVRHPAGRPQRLAGGTL